MCCFLNEHAVLVLQDCKKAFDWFSKLQETGLVTSGAKSLHWCTHQSCWDWLNVAERRNYAGNNHPGLDHEWSWFPFLLKVSETPSLCWRPHVCLSISQLSSCWKLPFSSHLAETPPFSATRKGPAIAGAMEVPPVPGCDGAGESKRHGAALGTSGQTQRGRPCWTWMVLVKDMEPTWAIQQWS